MSAVWGLDFYNQKDLWPVTYPFPRPKDDYELYGSSHGSPKKLRLEYQGIKPNSVKAVVIEAHARIETSMLLKHLTTVLCTRCGEIKPRGAFEDTQSRKKVKIDPRKRSFLSRLCLDCGVYGLSSQQL